MGIVRLQRMTFYGFHGVSRAERETGRRYEVDCELTFDFSAAGESDHLKDTINYREVYQAVERVLTADHIQLLETLATRIVVSLLEGFPVDTVRVRVRKMIPPIPGNLDYIEVELFRERAR
jgi:7,8-dihydroneopterin aldolase/epimerase/oxygenase